MWLKYSASVYLIVHTFATQISCNILNVSASSINQDNPYLWKIQHLTSSRNDSTTSRINQQQLSPIFQPFNSFSVDTVINNILISNRQGRNLKGYDEIYDNPEIKNALQLKNDTLARSYIHKKLCSLGLMNCDNSKERHQYYNRDIYPHDVIYAQPVTIKPIGQPLPAIPVKHPEAINSQKRGSFVSDSIYLGSTVPLLSKLTFNDPSSFISQPPSAHLGAYPDLKKSNINHNSRPVYESEFEGEINSENKFINKKQVILQTDSGAQKHIHHHFHYNNANGELIPINELRPVSNNHFNNYGYGDLYNNYEEYKHFKNQNLSPGTVLTADSLNNNYANHYPLYENLKKTSFYHKENMKQDFETSKRLNSEFASFNQLNNNLRNNEFGVKNKFESNSHFRQDNAMTNGLTGKNYNDCTCIPFNQCTMFEQTNRKDDLYVIIDPRNLGKNITADIDKIISNNSNSTIDLIQIKKSANETEQSKYKINEEKKIFDSIEVEKNKSFKNDQILYFGNKRIKRQVIKRINYQSPQAWNKRSSVCGPQHVCCRHYQLYQENSHLQHKQCGIRYNQGIAGRIKTLAFMNGDAEFGEYPWQVAILKRELEDKESVYVCGGSLISQRHIITAAHCIKTYSGRDLRVRLGEWDVNHDVEFFPYIERDIVKVTIHPEFYAGTLYNDISILKLDYDIDFEKNPHISPICLPDKFDDFINARCWTTGWGKDAFGDFGKYQNILKEVDVTIISNSVCEHQMRKTRLGPNFNLHPGFVCAGGEEGKDACKGDGGGPMVCEHHGKWQLAGIVSWGIGCGQPGIPGIYIRVSYYLDWIRQIINN